MNRFAFFFFAYYAYIGAFNPYVSLYFADCGIDVDHVAILMLLMHVTRIFGPSLWAWVADHAESRLAVLRVTAIIALLLFAGMFFASTFMQFFIIMLALNTCTGAQAPLSDALILHELRGDLSRYGRMRLWGSVGFIVATAGVGKLLDLYGIHVLPWLAWGLLAFVLLASVRMRETPHAPAIEVPHTMLALVRRPEVASFFVSTFMMIAAHAALYVFYSLYLEQIGYSKTVIGLMWALGVVVEVVFFYYQAPLFRRFGIRRVMLACLALAALRFLMIGLGAQSLACLLLAQVLHAATFAGHHSSSVLTLQRWFSGPLQARGQALYVSISYGLGGTIGTLLLKNLWSDVDGGQVFVAAAGMSLLGLIAAWWSYRLQAQMAMRTV